MGPEKSSVITLQHQVPQTTKFSLQKMNVLKWLLITHQKVCAVNQQVWAATHFGGGAELIMNTQWSKSVYPMDQRDQVLACKGQSCVQADS